MAALTTAAPACTGCVFGAVDTSLLSFSRNVIETITVEVIPHITVYADGTNFTSYESITETDAVVSGNGSVPATTYTNADEITWTVDGVTLTYPTTYIKYIAFAGAPATTGASSTCEQPIDASTVALPRTTNAASFIYPASNATAGVALPGLLLNYLDSLSTISEQFDGESLTACAPLATGVSAVASIPSPSYLTLSSKTYEGPRRSTTQVPQICSSLYVGNSTLLNSSSICNSISGPNPTNAPASTSVAYYSTNNPQSLSNTGTETGGAPNPENPHSTAYVIQPITGRAIVTTESSSVNTPPPVSPIHGGDVQSGGQPGTAIADQNPSATQGSNPGSDGLIGAIQSVAQQGSPGGGTADHTMPNSGGTGNLIGAIQSIVQQGQPGSGGQGEQGPQGGSRGPGAPPVFIAGGTTISANSNGQYQYGTQVLAPGGSITVGSGPSATVVVLETHGGSTQLVVGGSTINGQPPANTPALAAGGSGSQAIIVANGHTFTAVEMAGSVMLRDSTSTATLGNGAVTTFEGQSISAAPSGNVVVVNGQTYTLSATATPALNEVVFTTAGHTITAIQTGSAVILEDLSSTITFGDGSVVTFDGQTISALSNGAGVVDGTSTFSFTTAPASGGLGSYINSGISAAATSARSSGSASGAGTLYGAGNLRSVGIEIIACVCAVGGLIVL